MLYWNTKTNFLIEYNKNLSKFFQKINLLCVYLKCHSTRDAQVRDKVEKKHSAASVIAQNTEGQTSAADKSSNKNIRAPRNILMNHHSQNEISKSIPFPGFFLVKFSPNLPKTYKSYNLFTQQ